jgi:6-phosphogluconolactonase
VGYGLIRVLPDPEAAAHAAAEEVVDRAARTIATHGRFTLALAGGSTPRRLYELLATRYRDRVQWEHVRLLWGDERCVPPEDPRSNYAMARSTLLDRVPVSPEAVHRIRGELGPEAAADEYHDLIPATDRLDLALLGAGADGHTASLFPGQLQPHDRRWARGVRAPPGIEPPERVTLTLRALNAFTAALFLVTGHQKRDVVAAARDGTSRGLDPDPPAIRVRPEEPPLWIVDRAAAGP